MSANVDGRTADTISSSMNPQLRGAKTGDIPPILDLRVINIFCLAQDLNPCHFDLAFETLTTAP